MAEQSIMIFGHRQHTALFNKVVTSIVTAVTANSLFFFFVNFGWPGYYAV